MTDPPARATAPVAFIISTRGTLESRRNHELQVSTVKSHAAKAAFRKKREQRKPDNNSSLVVREQNWAVAQLSSLLTRRPSSYGFQVVDPFTTSGVQIDHVGHKLLRFYQAWTPSSTASRTVVESAIRNAACLYPLLAYISVIMDRLKLGGLDSTYVQASTSLAVTAIRTHLNSSQYQLDVAINGIVWMW